jgi:hypothetical protein
VPSTIIAPFMFVIIFFAAAQSTRSWYDLIAVMIIGALGVYLKRFGWPRPAFMIGFVLSTQLENGIYRVVQVYQWSFLTRPVALVLLAIVAISLGTALWYREHGRVLTKEGVHSHLGRLPQVLFFAVLFSATVYALIESFDWQYAAALFPRSVAIVTLLLLAPVGYVLLVAKSPNTAFFELEREEFSEGVEQHSNEYFLLWLLGYVGIIALAGFALGSAAFVYVFMWRRAQVSHLTCALSAGSVFALLAGLNFWLGITYVDGFLQTLDLPWPLN